MCIRYKNLIQLIEKNFEVENTLFFLKWVENICAELRIESHTGIGCIFALVMCVSLDTDFKRYMLAAHYIATCSPTGRVKLSKKEIIKTERLILSAIDYDLLKFKPTQP